VDRKLVEQLQESYPRIFRDLWGSPQKTCMAFGVCCGDGWFNLIERLCAAIMAMKPGDDFKVAQVKEKFGGLRFYCEGWPEDESKSKRISRLIQIAEEESFKVCEFCGSRDSITVEGAWIQTLCGKCRVHKKEFEEKLAADYKAAQVLSEDRASYYTPKSPNEQEALKQYFRYLNQQS